VTQHMQNRAPSCVSRLLAGLSTTSGLSFHYPGPITISVEQKARLLAGGVPHETRLIAAFNLPRETGLFLDALRRNGVTNGLWNSLRKICADETVMDIEVERLIAVSIESWPGNGTHLHVADGEYIFNGNSQYARRKPIPLSTRKRQTERIRDLAHSLANAMGQSLNFIAIPSATYWTNRDFEITIGQTVGNGGGVELPRSVLQHNAPTMLALLTRMRVHAESLLLEYQGMKAPKATRSNADLTQFRKRVCSHLLHRFGDASLTPLARIANAITHAGFPKQVNSESATLKELQRLKYERT
jgi:hypothetical protein